MVYVVTQFEKDDRVIVVGGEHYKAWDGKEGTVVWTRSGESYVQNHEGGDWFHNAYLRPADTTRFVRAINDYLTVQEGVYGTVLRATSDVVT
jgi:hypothetical protein